MKKTSLIVLLFFFLASVAFCQDRNFKDSPSSEEIEWSHLWVVSTQRYDLPRVLIIGDSHVEGYYQRVEEQLRSKAYCSKFTTSRSLGDPILMNQLEGVLSSFTFDVICFNNGLHGAGFTDKQYSSYIPKVYKLFKKNNPKIKIVWVNTTVRRVPNDLMNFVPLNATVLTRNKAVEDFAKTKNIPVVDSYTLSNEHPDYFLSDGVHFNEKGILEEAKGVVAEIQKALDHLTISLKK